MSFFKKLRAKLTGVETDFINIIKITQVGEVDYVMHLFNTYSNKAWVFKIYKPLFDKGMEIRKIIELKITTSEEEDEEEKKEKLENGAKIYA